MNKLKNKKLLYVLIPVVLVLVIVIVVVASGAGSAAVQEPTVDLRTKPAYPDKTVLSANKPDTSKKLEDGSYLVAYNDDYEMYLDESTLGITMVDKVTGSMMVSTVSEAAIDEARTNTNASWRNFIRSGVGLDLQVGNTTQQKKVGVNEAEISITLVDGGFVAKLDYPAYELGFEMSVLLYDEGFVDVIIPDSSIYENSEKNKIGNIYLYPMMGCSYLDTAEGYMLLPDGNGALIYLNDKENRYTAPYSQRAYGTDVGITEPYVLSLLWDEHETINPPEYVMGPIYGIAHTKDKMAFIAMVTKGAEAATIEGYPNGVYTDFNWAAAKFLKTTIYNEPTSNSGGSIVKVTDRLKYDAAVTFFFTRNEEANYAGMANRYRTYLMETGRLLQKDDGVFRLRADFLGSDRENWMFTTKAVPMTTTDDIREIYGELKQEGVTDLLTVYKGWQKGGINNLPVDSFKVDSAIGGTRDLQKLMEEAKEAGIQFYLYADPLRANPSTTNTTFNVIKKIDKRLYTENTYKDVYDSMRYLTAPRTNELLTNLVNSMAKKDINSLALTGITNTMFTYYYSGTIYDRLYTAEMQASWFESVKDSMDLVLEEPVSTYWKYTNAIIDMPVKDSDYIFTEESIPFLSIVMKGILPMYSDYVNFEANKNEFFLKLVETGIYPSFYLTMEDSTDLYYTNSNDLYSSQYSVYKDTIIQYYNVLKEFNGYVSGSMIAAHELKGNKVVEVTYHNGVVVTLDYKAYTFKVEKDGAELMSYKVGDAE